MFDRFDDRTLEITTVIVVVVIALVILCYLAIYLNPQVFFNPFKPSTATPVALVSATPTLGGPAWTPTWTPTHTATPTWTPTWTQTPTPTDTPTPTPTWTPTPLPTSTPLPPTATRRPRPPATKTPVPPPPYYYEYAGGRANCAATWVWGYVVGANGLGEPNVQMRVGSADGWKADTWTDDDGWYGYMFKEDHIAGTWFVRVFKGGQARSDQFWWQTSSGCDGPYSLQEVRIDWKRR